MLAIQSVWAWAVPVTVSKAPVEGFVNETDSATSPLILAPSPSPSMPITQLGAN